MSSQDRDPPPGFVTVRPLVVAGGSGGDVSPMCWASNTTADASRPPSVAVAPGRKKSPVTVAGVPPLEGPDAGVMP